MAISETILKDLMLMQVAELNANGGLLGKKIEPVVVDPASNWPLFAEKARELHQQGQGGRRVRLLDLGVAQVGAAGIRGTERPAFLSAGIRRRGSLLQHLLWQLGAGQQSDPGGRIPDERRTAAR